MVPLLLALAPQGVRSAVLRVDLPVGTEAAYELSYTTRVTEGTGTGDEFDVTITYRDRLVRKRAGGMVWRRTVTGGVARGTGVLEPGTRGFPRTLVGRPFEYTMNRRGESSGFASGEYDANVAMGGGIVFPNGRVAVGETYSAGRNVAGRRILADYRVVGFVPNQGLRIEATLGGPSVSSLQPSVFYVDDDLLLLRSGEGKYRFRGGGIATQTDFRIRRTGLKRIRR